MFHFIILCLAILAGGLCTIDLVQEIVTPYETDPKDGITAGMVRRTVSYWTGLGIHVAAITLMIMVATNALDKLA